VQRAEPDHVAALVLGHEVVGVPVLELATEQVAARGVVLVGHARAAELFEQIGDRCEVGHFRRADAHGPRNRIRSGGAG
jgi:hypothetical protein